MSELTRKKTKNAKRIVWFCVGGIIFTLVAFAFVARELSIEDQLEAQAAFDPCVSLSEAVANKNRDRIPPLTRDCKKFLSGLGPLVTIKLSCAIIEKARYVCPAPGTAGAGRSPPRDGVPLGPALTDVPPSSNGSDGAATDNGDSEPPTGGGGGELKPPDSGSDEPLPPQGDHDGTSVPTSPGVTASPPPIAAPSAPGPGAGPADPPGLLNPGLSKVCDFVDQVAHLC